MHGWRVYSDFHHERVRAHAKHDDHGQSMERKEWLDRAWLEVLIEEVGEVAHELNDQRHNGVFPTGAEYRELRQRVRTELVQCGAMIAAWVEAIDEDRCDASLDSQGGRVTCRLDKEHEATQHLDWSGRYQWD